MTATTRTPATPLPWATDQHQSGIDIVNEETLFTVARAVGFGLNSVSPKMVIENAAYIVHACNLYAVLVDALREVRTTTADRACVPIIEEALKKAGEL